jgi:multimeric flavodoxin WrbA
MKLTVFNGSPRGTDSNTKVLLASFLDGFVAGGGNSYELALLIQRQQKAEHVHLFQQAEHVLVAFPLYFDAMPAIVKEFIESLEPFCGRLGNPPLSFIVQSGFPESLHSRPVVRYLEKLAGRLGCHYQGTVIQGGAEGMRVPPLQTSWFRKGIIALGKATNIGRVGHLFDVKKIRKTYFDLGRIYGETGVFDTNLAMKLAQPGKVNIFGFWVVQASICNFYWDHLLKLNHAYERRFDRPFAKELP